MSQKRIHLWMPDGRSLCAKFEHQNAVMGDEYTPCCGSCLLVADAVIGGMRSLIDWFSKTDQTPAEALEGLSGTSWPEHWLFENHVSDGLPEDYYFYTGKEAENVGN
ncbi:hypothetical protein [Rhodococcoides fascians]|uniref:hypothetical protein n=1 Tax=Rhodococcoides fascians TaxID=1828 RepID=UPI0005674D29|nr:hypothetical protein [Rhodococcus fascians]